MGVMTQEERAEFEKPYAQYSAKRKGESGHETASMKGTKISYSEGEQPGEGEEPGDDETIR